MSAVIFDFFIQSEFLLFHYQVQF